MWWFAALLFLLSLSALDIIVKARGPATPHLLHPHCQYRSTNLHSVDGARFLNNQKGAKAHANEQTKIHLVTKRDSRRAKTHTRRVWRGIRGNETSPWPYHYSCQYRESAFLLDGYSHSQGNPVLVPDQQQPAVERRGHATPSTRMYISLQSVTKSIGLVRSASAPYSSAPHFVSPSPIGCDHDDRDVRS